MTPPVLRPRDSVHTPFFLDAFCSRHFTALALAVLALAAFNIGFRITRESVVEWDESLYAVSAFETMANHTWIGITSHGHLDYYNAKPPLNVWLIALAFKAFGVNLLSLRLASLAASWVSVAVLVWWGRRVAGPAAAIASGVVLSTMFGFLQVHSGRTAETDAVFTLLLLLVAVTLWAAAAAPRLLLWLAPLIAGAFLLRGMAVLMPLALVVAVESRRQEHRRTGWLSLLLALALAVALIAPWAMLRWQLDGATLFRLLVGHEFMDRTAQVLEGHEGGVLYYLNILQKHHYDWLVAAVAAIALFPIARTQLRPFLRFWSGDDRLALITVSWAVVALIVPTIMRTKLPWYLNPFYPVFSLAVGWTIVHAMRASPGATTARRYVLTGVLVLALGTAEGKLIWYSFQFRDVTRTAQGLLLAERDRLRGRRVYAATWNNADRFVAESMVTADPRVAADAGAFTRDAQAGDFFLAPPGVTAPQLVLMRTDGTRALYLRAE